MMEHHSIDKGGIWNRMVLVDVTGPHLSRQPLAPNKTVQTCQPKTIDNKPILHFCRQFIFPSAPWYTDLTPFQGNFQQRQHLIFLIYSPSWGIGLWWKKMIEYYVTKKFSISTLNEILYTRMYNYVDANSWRYIFEQEPTKKITPSCTFLHKCDLLMHWINRPFMRAKVDRLVSWLSGGEGC